MPDWIAGVRRHDDPRVTEPAARTHPDARRPVHSADPEPYSAPCPIRRQLKAAAIPADSDGGVAHLCGICAHAWGLPAAGNGNLPVESYFRQKPVSGVAPIVGRKPELPVSIQR